MHLKTSEMDRADAAARAWEENEALRLSQPQINVNALQAEVKRLVTAVDWLAERVTALEIRLGSDQGDPMHPTTFEYLKPTDEQIARMATVRQAAKEFCDVLERELPGGPDKTYLIRQHRQTAMWANVAITRDADGAPRV